MALGHRGGPERARKIRVTTRALASKRRTGDERRQRRQGRQQPRCAQQQLRAHQASDVSVVWAQGASRGAQRAAQCAGHETRAPHQAQTDGARLPGPARLRSRRLTEEQGTAGCARGQRSAAAAPLSACAHSTPARAAVYGLRSRAARVRARMRRARPRRSPACSARRAQRGGPCKRWRL